MSIFLGYMGNDDHFSTCFVRHKEETCGLLTYSFTLSPWMSLFPCHIDVNFICVLFHFVPSLSAAAVITGDGCCEILDSPVVFDTLVFWGNSQPSAVDQEDLVMTKMLRKQKYDCVNDVMARR